MACEIPADAAAPAVWQYFSALTEIPRPSGHEEEVRRWLLTVAAVHGWEERVDTAGNVCLAVPGRAAGDAPIIVLQAHMDMVCEQRPGLDIDFTRTGITAVVDGPVVRAEGTTLGADNGLGIALALAVATADLPARCPLELLFTIDEETGLTGALHLDPAIVRGRCILNLDSEEDGLFTIGCAGGIDIEARFPVSSAAPGPAWRLDLGGCRGGHSGINIAAGRANAIRVVADIVAALEPVQVQAIIGGTKKNAIPRECSAILADTDNAAIQEAVARVLDRWRAVEPDIAARIEPVEPATQVLPGAIIDFLCRAPCGVIARDPDFPDLVRTSNSIGVVETDTEGAHIVMHGRSASNEERDRVAADIVALARQCGAEATVSGAYPGWPPNPDSALLARAVDIHHDLFGTAPKVRSIHAGLEAGIIGDKLDTDEMLAIGPQIDNPHSPAETVEIASVDRCWRVLQALVTP